MWETKMLIFGTNHPHSRMNILGPTCAWHMLIPLFLPLEHTPLLISINLTSNPFLKSMAQSTNRRLIHWYGDIRSTQPYGLSRSTRHPLFPLNHVVQNSIVIHPHLSRRAGGLPTLSIGAPSLVIQCLLQGVHCTSECKSITPGPRLVGPRGTVPPEFGLNLGLFQTHQSPLYRNSSDSTLRKDEDQNKIQSFVPTQNVGACFKSRE